MYTFASYQDKEKCELIAEYLNDQFTMFRDYPLQVHDFGDTGHYWNHGWCLITADYCQNYRQTIEQARSAATDFWYGYNKGLEKK